MVEDLSQRRLERDRADYDALDAQHLRDAGLINRKRPERRRFHFDRSICLGDVIVVIGFAGTLLGGVWFASAQNAKLDSVATTVGTMQTDITGIKVDVGSLKAKVNDIHNAMKKE